MVIRGRTLLAAIVASTFLLLFSADAFPSYNTEAGHKLVVARERLADLKRSPKKKKYRSYWMDSIRMLELVEKKYPNSPAASDACFDRAGAYLDLYQYNRHSRDLEDASRAYEKCQASYPKHDRAPEALYRVIVIDKEQKKDTASAMGVYKKLAEAYPDSTWTSKAKSRLGIKTTAQNGKKKNKEPELRKVPEAVIAAPKALKDLGVVKNVRYWSGGAYTRIVIDLDKPLKFQAHELKNPDRLVFDIKDARMDVTATKDPLPVNDGILKQVRTNQNAPDMVRVVLDLASLKSYVAFPLHEPERLVVDVTGLSADEEEETALSVATAPAATLAAPDPPASPEPKEGPPPVVAKGGAGKGKDKDGKLSLSRQLGLKVRTIAIDAGHGGKDPGAVGKSGLREKTVTLDVAKRLAVLVKERLGCNVVMTRDRDVFIELEQRPFIAKSKGADLFVSIHSDYARRSSASGATLYIGRRNSPASTRAADCIFAALRDAGIKCNGIRRKDFHVLVDHSRPAILIECGYMSNRSDSGRLNDPTYRTQLAEAITNGIARYFGK